MPQKIDIAFILNKSPQEIVDYFKSKGYAISWNWRDVWKEAHHKAFTVAKATNADVLQSIRNEVENAMENGTTLREFQKNLEPTLKKLGWWGKKEIVDTTTGEVQSVQLGSPWRLRTIYQTNMQVNYNAGRYKAQEEFKDDRPYWMYVAVMDARTRPSHAARDGEVYAADDPVWNWMYPPNDWGCRCRVRTLSKERLDNLDKTVSNGKKVKDFAGEGWDYNPAKHEWKPDMKQYHPDIRKQLNVAEKRYVPLDVAEK